MSLQSVCDANLALFQFFQLNSISLRLCQANVLAWLVDVSRQSRQTIVEAVAVVHKWHILNAVWVRRPIVGVAFLKELMLGIDCFQRYQ